MSYISNSYKIVKKISDNLIIIALQNQGSKGRIFKCNPKLFPQGKIVKDYGQADRFQPNIRINVIKTTFISNGKQINGGEILPL